MKIDYYGKPKESLEYLLSKYGQKIFINIDELLSSIQIYKIVYQDLIDIMKWGFEIDEIRNKTLIFKFNKDAKKQYKMQIRHFISNMILWRAFIDMDQQSMVNESLIFDFTKFNMNDIVKYIDTKILPHHSGDFASRNKTVDEICYNINAISNTFSLLMGMSMSIYDIIQSEKRNPEMSDLIFGPIDTSLQPVEIEKELKRRTERLIELFSNDVANNSFKPLFNAGKILSDAQFKEMLVKIGMKSDINGNTIPSMINANFMIDGLNKPSYVYINSLGGRKSLILTKSAIAIPGAFSKKLNHLTTSPSYLRQDYEVCDSIGFVEYNIKDEIILKMLHGRNYYNSRGELKELNYETDGDLIGKIIAFKSPCTCSSNDGICKECYGHLFDMNREMVSVGALAATKLTEKLSQAILSSKHSQSTFSDTIKFNDEFDDIFELSSSEVSFKDDADIDADLFIQLGKVESEESDDEEFYFTNSFKIIDTNNEIIYNIIEENDANLYLSDTLLTAYKRLKDKNKPIPLDVFDSESGVLFTVEIKSKELTDPVKMVQKILNSKDHMGARTISELCQIFAENLIDMGSRYDLVHAETVIRAFLRKKSNELEFPDFSRAGDPEDIQILTLNNALFKNPSAIISISCGYLRKHLLSPKLYQKESPSHLDTLFVSNLSEHIY